MKRISLKSPAKLNLFLKVVNKRKDGYHNIVTLFERIDLCDDIRLSSNRHGAIRIFCNDSKVPLGQKNLAYKAAKLIQNDFALKNGVDVRITKRIPVAAGLAGGSSNAATVLLGLNKIWKLSLTRQELLRYAKKIGSDVPFFLYDCSWAVGREKGDTIRGLSLRRKLWHILVIPELKVYSREAFGAFKLQLTHPAPAALLRPPRQAEGETGKAKQRGPSVSTLSISNQKKRGYTNVLTKIDDNVNILIRALRKNDLSKLRSLLSNDLEAVVGKLYPCILRLKERLVILRAKGAVLSGSGPAMFSIARSRHEAEILKTRLKKYYKRVFVVSTL